MRCRKRSGKGCSGAEDDSGDKAEDWAAATVGAERKGRRGFLRAASAPGVTVLFPRPRPPPALVLAFHRCVERPLQCPYRPPSPPPPSSSSFPRAHFCDGDHGRRGRAVEYQRHDLPCPVLAGALCATPPGASAAQRWATARAANKYATAMLLWAVVWRDPMERSIRMVPAGAPRLPTLASRRQQQRRACEAMGRGALASPPRPCRLLSRPLPHSRRSCRPPPPQPSQPRSGPLERRGQVPQRPHATDAHLNRGGTDSVGRHREGGGGHGRQLPCVAAAVDQGGQHRPQLRRANARVFGIHVPPRGCCRFRMAWADSRSSGSGRRRSANRPRGDHRTPSHSIGRTLLWWTSSRDESARRG